jgi:hypothetical protein
MPMITTLANRIAALSDGLRQTCERIFHVATMTGYTDPPATMEAWIVRHFGTVDAVREQTIVRVVNRLTLEGALFNPLRARRPTESVGGDTALESRIAATLAGVDNFRDPLRDTTADLFGRIRGRFCVTASNVAKYDGWHGLVIFDEPHPLRFDRARLSDYLDVAFRWIAAAYAHDDRAIYPIITWNCLPKSGATLMHGHMQLALARGMPYARVENWRRAAETYRTEHSASYFNDLFAIHEALGLAIPQSAGQRVFAHLTPIRNREVIFLADPQDIGQGDKEIKRQAKRQAVQRSLSAGPLASLSQRIAEALYPTLRNLIDKQGMRALRVTAEDWGDFPTITRLADRGNPLATSSDIGAIELFATGCVTADPFEVAAAFSTNRP